MRSAAARAFGQRKTRPQKPKLASNHSPARKRKSIDDLIALAEDKRKYRRIKVRLPGRFMRENHSEHPCYTEDISAGGISVCASIKCEPGENIVFYIEEIGRIEAIVIRNYDGGFAAIIEASAFKREKLVASLTWLLNRHEFDASQTRQFERRSPSNHHSLLVQENGTQIEAKILDLSLGGARINVKTSLQTGEKVTLGKSRGIVVRSNKDEIAIQFETTQSLRVLQPYFS